MPPLARRILVVEDEEDVRGYIVAILRAGGYAVEEATCLAEARSALAQHRYDVLVSDIGLPDGDGLELLPEVAAAAPSTRVVICSASATWENAVRAMKAGAWDFLTKPVQKEALRGAVRRSIDARRLEEENAVLVYRLAEKVSTLRKIHEITREVNGSLDLPVVLSRALDRTVAFFGAEGGSILLRNADDSLVFAVARGRAGEPVVSLAGRRVDAGKGIAGWVVGHRRPIIVNDTSRDPRFGGAIDAVTGFRTRSILACPLKVKDRVIGVLEVVNGEGKFTREHRLAAETLSFPIAAAIENARITTNLHEHQALLVEQSALLERKVADRTRELRESNGSLALANRSLELTRDQMVRAEKMASIGTIAAGVAHEINNPIGFINSNLQTLRGYIGDLKPLIEDYRRIAPADAAIEARAKKMDLDFVLQDLETLVHESEDGVKRVVKIVKDLKTFSHSDRGAPEDADLNSCIEAAVNLSRNETKYSAEVTLVLAEMPRVRCWPGQITQVLVNLIVNAAHAIKGEGESERHGAITVRSRVEAEFAIVEVVDDGCGIPKEIASRIFDPFFTTKEPGRGTGLGLSLSYEIVERHRGELRFTSELGHGTTFEVRIPLAGPGVAIHPAPEMTSQIRESRIS